MAGTLGLAPPDLWPAGWYHAQAFASAPQTPAALRDWLAQGLDPQVQSYVWWAAASERAGFALIYHQSAAQVGFWLSPELRGRGWGKAALRRALRQLPADGTALILAVVAGDNPAACRAAQACGLRQIAAQPARRIFCLERRAPL